MATQDLRIFYSWQSDSPAETNRNAIRAALKSAAKKLEAARPGLKIVRDEATRGVSGSPNIVAKIHEKIELCDIFVADITTVTSARAKRPCPNPNVGYELGFAVAHIGWDRIILMFNEAFGKFPGDLPFDFAQHRAGTYKCPVVPATAEKENLAKFVEGAIAMVLDQKPKRPAELRGVPREKLEHDHDVQNMKWLMSKIHLPTMDVHIDEMPYKIPEDAFWFWEHFKGIVTNSLFHVYDPILNDAVQQLYLTWLRALSHDNEYVSIVSGRAFVFHNPLDLPLPRKRQAAWDDIENARIEMKRSLDKLLKRLRESYIEVNLRETNEAAWKAYVTFNEEFERIMRPI